MGCGSAQYLWVWFGSVYVGVVRLSICGCGGSVRPATSKSMWRVKKCVTGN